METNDGINTVKQDRLPLIPLSPLTQTSIDYAKDLARTTLSLSETTAEELADINSNSAKTSNILSLLNQDFSKEKDRLDRLTKEIQNIQSQFLVDLNTYDIAKEIAYINCSLFRLVVLDKIWLLNFDKQSNMVPLLDFHRYVSHSFCHQIIYSAVEDDDGGRSKKNKRRSLIGSSSSSSSSNIIGQVIQIAYILLHIYRDFSGCTALLTSLQMPEVQRLERLWAQCPSKLLFVYKELVTILSPQNNYEAYQHCVLLHTARFLETTAPLFKSQIIAVPFMQAHLAIIRNLIKTHSVIEINSSNVLSHAGEKWFISVIHVLEFCQQHSKIDPADLKAVPPSSTVNRQLSMYSNRRRSSNSLNSTFGMKLSMSLCLELDRLHCSPNMYHWLVSRPYLTRAQLYQESLLVEPLAIGEIELETEEEYDLYWDFFNLPSVILLNTTMEYTMKQKNALKQQVEQQEQNIVDDLVIVTSHHQPTTAIKQQQEDGGHDEQNLHSFKVDDSLHSEVILSPTSIAGNSTTDTAPKEDMISHLKVNDDKQDIIGEETNTDVQQAEERDYQQQPSDNVNEYDDGQTDIIVVTEGEENTQLLGMPSLDNNHTVAVESPTSIDINREYYSEFDDKKRTAEVKDDISIQPTLSPTAPEFIPQPVVTQSSDEEEIVFLTTEGITSSNSSNYDVVIEEEEDEEVEEEEEWTGYPLEDNVIGTDMRSDGVVVDYVEERWTGCPTTSSDIEEIVEVSGEDEEEVWKGYPAPQQEPTAESQLTSSSTFKENQHPRQQENDVTNQSDNEYEEEEWKGYQKTSVEIEADLLLSAEEQAVVGKDYPISWNHSDRNQLHAIGKAAARKMQNSVSNTDNRKRLPSSFTPSSTST